MTANASPFHPENWWYAIPHSKNWEYPSNLRLDALVLCAGCVLIGVDQHSCMYMMRTMNTRDPVTEVAPLYLVNMFEYLFTSGFDFWDVLTAVKSGRLQDFFPVLIFGDIFCMLCYICVVR